MITIASIVLARDFRAEGARTVSTLGLDGLSPRAAHPPLSVDPHTHIHLLDVEDAAPANGFGERWEARVARIALGAEETGVTHFRLRPGKRSPFTHRHRQAEEIYVILSGSGRIKLDDELTDVRPLDAIRVAPGSLAPSRPGRTASSSSPSDRTTRTESRSRTPGPAETRQRRRSGIDALIAASILGDASPVQANTSRSISTAGWLSKEK